MMNWGFCITVLINLLRGFFVMTALIAVYCIFSLVKVGESWLGLLYFLILLLPLSHFVSVCLKERGTENNDGRSERWGKRLFIMQGTALACWAFDIFTTFYAINVTHLASEINPLGWPLGIVGALIFYGPTLLFSHILISRINGGLSFFVVTAISSLMFCMGLLNLMAGVQNLVFFLNTVNLPIALRYPFLIMILTVDLIFVVSRMYCCKKFLHIGLNSKSGNNL